MADGPEIPLATAMVTLGANLEPMREGLKRAVEETQALSGPVGQIADKLKDANRAGENVASALNTAAGSAGKLSGSLDSAQQSAGKLDVPGDKLADQIDTASVSAGKMGSTLSRLGGELDKLGVPGAEVVKTFGEAATQADRMGKAIGDAGVAGGWMSKVAGWIVSPWGLAAAGVALLVKGIHDAAAAADSLEQSLNNAVKAAAAAAQEDVAQQIETPAIAKREGVSVALIAKRQQASAEYFKAVREASELEQRFREDQRAARDAQLIAATGGSFAPPMAMMPSAATTDSERRELLALATGRIRDREKLLRDIEQQIEDAQRAEAEAAEADKPAPAKKRRTTTPRVPKMPQQPAPNVNAALDALTGIPGLANAAARSSGVPAGRDKSLSVLELLAAMSKTQTDTLKSIERNTRDSAATVAP